MKKLFAPIKNRIWDALFLDFYLDPRYTFRFKLMNLISGDTLRSCLSAVKYDVERAHSCIEQDKEYGIQSTADLFVRRAEYWANALWKYFER